MHGFISGFLSYSIDLYIFFCPATICFDDYSFVVQSKVKDNDSSSSALLSQDCFGYLGVFVFPCKLNFFCAISVKNVIGHLTGIALNLQIPLGSLVILINSIDSSNPRTWYIFLSACVFFSISHQCHSFQSLFAFLGRLFLGILSVCSLEFLWS